MAAIDRSGHTAPPAYPVPRETAVINAGRMYVSVDSVKRSGDTISESRMELLEHVASDFNRGFDEMIAIKTGVERWIQVRLTYDGTGQPASGILYSQVVVWIAKNNSALVYKPITTDDWVNLGRNGLYHIKLSASDTDTSGTLLILIEGPGLHPHTAICEVTDYRHQDLMDTIKSTGDDLLAVTLSK